MTKVIREITDLVCDYHDDDHAGVTTLLITDQLSGQAVEIEVCEDVQYWFMSVGRLPAPPEKQKRPTPTRRSARMKSGTTPRRKRRKATQGNLGATALGLDPKVIRQWCADNRIPCNANGKIPQHVLDQYMAAH